MEKVEATFRVVTPMFMSGAEQTRAELRLPSIKGALRFWWRALAWERHEGKLEKIREEENKLFGSTDTGQAAVLMRLKPLDNLEQFLTTQEAKDWKISDWQSYVGYGLIDKKERSSRQYVKPGFRFRVCLGARNKETLGMTENALKAFGLLGGLGGRSRKGWGSVNLQSLEGTLNWSAPGTEEAYQNEVSRLLNSYEKRPTFTAFSGKTEVEFGKLQRSAEAAHKYLATIYKDAARHGYDKREREQFGLPRKGNQQRRASPVFLHIHDLTNGQALPVTAWLPAQFLENQLAPAGDDSKIQVFLKAVADGGLE